MSMLFKYNTDRLSEIVEKFQSLTGVGMGVYNTQYEMTVTPGYKSGYCRLVQSSAEGRRRCGRCDKEIMARCAAEGCAVTHRCHAGLCDTALPIKQDDVLLGFIMFGQVRDGDGIVAPFEEIYPLVADICPNEEELRLAYGELTLLDSEKIADAAEIVGMLTKYICLERMIQPEYSEQMWKLVEYIDTSFRNEISIESLCRGFNISKNTLYSYFKSAFDCTVGEYIERLRIKEAKNLLENTDMPIYEVCAASGIDNYQYFCRRFKQLVGETPLKYRKNHKKTF